MKDLKTKWQNETRKKLVGKTIKHVRYMTDDEMEDFMWYRNPVVITFTDGTILVPQSDDEGNDGGSMMYIKNNKTDIIPTL